MKNKYQATVTYRVEVEAESNQQAWEIIMDAELPYYVPDTLEMDYPVKKE
jgi:hypothetical protein